MDVQLDPGAKRPSFMQWVVVLVVLLIVAALAIPGFFSSGRMSNQQNASSRLHTLCSAEADFRASDRDGNHVNDFWTGDVKSLYTLTSAAVPGPRGGTEDPPIKLIGLSLAAADADGTFVEAGGENTALSLYLAPSAKAGYWYAALSLDLNSSGTLESTYKLDTGGTPKMGSCHNMSKFGFVAFPDSESAGPFVLIVNQNNTVFRRVTIGPARTANTLPPGPNGFQEVYQNWPKETELKSGWSPLD
jgi:type II secretory pathway pseudopilin PulG